HIRRWERPYRQSYLTPQPPPLRRTQVSHLAKTIEQPDDVANRPGPPRPRRYPERPSCPPASRHAPQANQNDRSLRRPPKRAKSPADGHSLFWREASADG